jgi:hypothetical protein
MNLKTIAGGFADGDSEGGVRADTSREVSLSFLSDLQDLPLHFPHIVRLVTSEAG